ncbi:aldo/keto reductase [Candidatus Woesearchaeota archaeon]|nr:aldo/keto reductase [Candidatus Woesearchaeota archaeon]MCF7900819.1 aldo/keto reductase [Candidatus Woesearchaeota archaeon]MCF8013121.1 aldo/keto reductase [Candidatus Woesearchaeota archaeon]
MKYSKLSNTNISVSKLCLGCANFGERTDYEEAEKIVLAAMKNGINFFDTANVYPNQGLEGRSERILGKIIKKHNLRDKIILATKVRARMSSKKGDSGLKKKHILEQIKGSLDRLQTSFVDIYQFHRPDDDVPVIEQLSAIDLLVKKNLVHFHGLSSFVSWKLVEQILISKANNFQKIVSLQEKYNLLDRQLESQIIDICKKYDISILAYSPLEGGLLSGKYDLNNPSPKNARHTIWKKDFTSEENLVLLTKADLLKKMAQEKGITLVQLSIAWILQNKAITSCIIGPRNIDQFNEYVSALKINLTDEDLQRIDDICPPLYAKKISKNSMFRK